LRYYLIILLIFNSLSFLLAQEHEKDNELIEAVYNNDVDAVKRLLTEGANVNAKTQEDVTPLMYAAQNGNKEILEMLLASGASVNEKPTDGFSALSSACLFNHLDVAITLIENNADINTFNIYGATPLMIASAYGYYIIADMLLFYGAEKELKDEYGNTALNSAATHGFFDIVALLLDKGADINTKDIYGFTPLMSAVIKNEKETVDTLLNRNADVNQQSLSGYTALMLAVRDRNDSIINILLKKEFDKTLLNKYGLSVADLAYVNKNVCLYKCIKDDNKTFFNTPFNTLNIASAFSTSFKDVFYNYELGISKQDLSVFAGHAIRLGRKSILIKQADNLYHQYNEKRSYLYIGISKNFVLHYNAKTETGLNLAINGAYTYANVKGTTDKIASKFMIIPSAGVYRSFDFFSTKLSYEYANFKYLEASPHYLKFSTVFSINLLKNPKHNKYIYWVY